MSQRFHADSRRPAFRLGSTSYVYPGDLVYNVEHLAGMVQDIELILFETPSGESNVPQPATVARLAKLAHAHTLTYTVHLPADLRHTPGSQHPSLAQAQRVIELTAPLEPHAYVFHVEGTGAGEPAWLDQAHEAVAALVGMAGDPGRLALENLESYAPEALAPIFDAFPIRRALDIGHLWKAGRNPLPVMAAWLPHASVVHLHGMAATDHQSLAVTAPAQLDPLLAGLLDWPGVLTLEVFEDDFFTSRDALSAAIARICGADHGTQTRTIDPAP